MKRNSLLHACADVCASLFKQFEWKKVTNAPVLEAKNSSDDRLLPIFRLNIRKAGFLAVLLLTMLLNVRQGWSQSAGFNNTFIVLSLNGGANTFYDLNAATANTDFNNANLGTFAAGSTNLTLKGAEHNVFKCGGADLTSTRLYYRVYPTASPSGSFISQSIGFTSGFNNGCGGQDQVWSNTGLTINVLAGLGAGSYTLEVYSDATITCCGGTAFASNSGNNYKATFTVSSILWANTGAATAWYTNTNWTPNTASGAWLTGSVAEFQNAGTATTAGINMGTASLSIGQVDVTAARTRVLTIGNSSATTGTLTLNGASAGTNANVILRNSSGSLLTLQNNETGTGKTMNIALGNATTNTIDAAGSGGIAISSVISGASRSITKIGTGTLTLSGTNTYSGGTIISGGTVSASAAANLGDAAGAITLGSGSTFATLAATGTFTRNALNVTTSSSAGVIDVAASQTLTLAALNTASGTDNTTKIGKSGAGTLTLSSAGSYVGQTQIGQGTVIVSNNAGLGTNNSTTARGIDLGLNVGDVSQANNVSVLATNGITVPQSIYVAPNTSSATRTIGTSGASASATFSNEVYLDGNATLAPVSGGTLTMSGSIINTGGLITTTGTTLLSGTNTFSGTTTVSSGTLRLGSTSALGSTAAATSITSGAVLDLNGVNYSSAEALTVNGTGISSGGAVINGSATGATYAGLLTLGSASSIIGGSGTIAISNTGTITGSGFGLTLGGAQGGSIASIIGTGAGTLTKQDAGTWTLSGANTYTGATTISAGILRLGAAGVIADGSAISLGGGTLSSGASSGFSETMGTLALTANSTIALGTGNHTLTFANSSAVSWTAATTLTITGWTGTEGASGTAGKIFVGNTTGTLTSGQLAQISFSGYSSGAMLLNTGEVVPLLSAPTVATTVAASSITNTSASSGGQTITGTALTAKGVVYSTAAVSTSPTLSNSVLTDGATTTANFTSNLTGLDAETQYYVRAYATNAAGTGYASAINFRTLSNPPTAQATALSASVSASGELTINWSGATFPSSGATQGGYALIYSTGSPTLSSANGSAPSAGVGTLITISPATLPTTPATSYVLSGLTGGTTYNFLLVPFTFDGTNASTYNYLTTSAPTTSATAVTTASVTTTSISAITNTTASSGGSAINAGGGTISAKGAVWNTSTAPTTANSLTTDGTGTGSYTSSLTSLNAQTLYYYRAYVTNAVSTVYGSELTFRTLSAPATAQASALSASPTASGTLTINWTAATFPSSGATQGGYALIYSTGTPTLSSANGSAPTAGVGTLVTITPTNLPSTPATSYVLNGLTGGTTYNFLLVPFTFDGTNAATYNYLTASAPTTSAVAVTTASVTTTAASSVTNNTASSGGSAISAGGGTISAKGVVWNTSTAPTTANSSTSDGTGTSSFSSSLSSLSAQTLYYYRAYATNEVGTVYGNELTFRTLSNEPTAEAGSFAAASNGSSQIDLSWTVASFPGTGASNNGYIVLRRIDSTNPTTTGINDGTAPASLSLPSGTTLVTTITSGSTTSYNHTGLIASTQYNYIIVPFTWDGSNASTYNYYLTAAPTANATTDAGLPSVDVTTAATSITNNSASSGGSTLVAGGSAITAKGVAYNTTGTPTTADNTTSDGSGTTNYTSSLTGLSAQTLYYVRAYVTNTAGTGYGNEINFRTLSNPATAQASGLSATASASGELTVNWTGATFPSSGATQGGYALIYSTGTPTLSSTNATAPAAGTGTLVTITPTNLPTAPATSYVLSGLTAGTTYNFLLVPFTWNGTNANTYNYLTASAPTTSGTAVSPASVTTTAISSITSSTATSGGNSVTAGGGTISAKGVVWNTSTTPTTSNSSTSNGTGTASYSSSLTALSAQTLYYTRAYVTNEIGTVYGNEITFRTLSAPATAQASALSASPTASGTLTINWTAATFPSSDATQGGYALIYSTGTPTLSSANGNAPAAGVGTLVTITPTNLPSTPATSYVLNGLTGGTTYNFLLVPFTFDGTNATTYNYLTASAPTTSAVAVTTASVTTTAASSVTNSTASSGGSAISAGGGTISAKGVVWNTSTAPTTANSSTSDGTGTSAFSSSLTSLSGQTLYYYRAYVTNDVGTAYGNELTFRTLSNPPTAQASGLTATASSSSNINLSWTAASFPASGASVTGYVLLRATSPNTPSLANNNGAAPSAGANTTIVSSSISGASTSASSSGLAALTAYNYLLVPFTWDGVNTSTYNYLTTSAPIANATTFASLPIAQPTALAFSAVTATTITTSWTAAAGGPSGYIVLRAAGAAPNTDPVSGTTYTAGNTLGNATVVFSAAGTTTGAQTGLVDGTTYYYKVYSYNGTGSTRNYLTTSPLSGSQATAAVSAPTATAGTSITDSGFTANWNSVAGAASYQLDVFPLTYDSFDNSTTLFSVSSGTGVYYTGNSAGTDRPASTSFVSNGTHSFGKSAGSVTVTTSNINTTALVSPQLSFKLASFSVNTNTNGADAADIVTVEISADGGNTYSSTIRVLGNTNACWGFASGTGVASTAYDGDASPVSFAPAGGALRTTDGYSTVTVTGLPSTTNMRVRITLLNDNANERWLIDNFTISPAPSNISGYNSLSVAGTSQTVTGLSSNTTYGYVVRAVGTNTTSGNSNTIAVTTLVGQSDADYRTIASGNFSTASNWEYNNGTSWTTATQAPGANNNTTVQSAHSITMDVAHSMNTGKTMTVNGALNAGTYVISGGTFALASAATLTIGSVDGIASSGATGNIQTTTRTFNAGANYIYAGSAAQITGTALPSTITGSLAIQSGANTVTLTNTPTTTDSLSLQSGLFAIGSGATLNISATGKIIAAGGNFATGATGGTVNFVGLGSFSGNCNPYNVYANSGVNFGSGTVTIQNGGTFRINSGGYVDTNAPFYGSGSTLQYNVGAAYGRSLEWSASSGRGYPHHVTISNNTTFNPAGTAGANAGVALRTAGSLTIDNGSSFYMDYSGNNMTEDLVVLGDMTMNGNCSGSGASGSDIFVGGSWTNNGTSANFFPNNRAVFLNGAGTQTIAGTNVSFPAFPYLFIDKTSGSVVLSRDAQVTTQLVLSSANTANINAGSFTLNVSGTATTAIDRQGSGHIIGNLRRGIGTGTNSFAYPIGDASNYTPVTLNFNNVTGAGSVTMKSTPAEQIQIGSSGLDSTLSVNRYFTISNNATTFTSYTATLNFVSGDRDAGITTNDLLVGLFGATWSYPNVGTITATSIQATGISTFGDFAIAECKSPAIYTVTGGGEYCAGSGGVDVSISDSELGVSYQLKKDGVNTGSAVPGTGSALSFGNQTGAGVYTVIANSLATSNCNNTMSGSALVSINSVVTPTISISTSATTFCAGTSVTFTATPQYGGATPSYQWKVNGSNAGTNSATFITSTLADGDVVSCVLTSSEACPSPATATSNAIDVSVIAYETPTITIGVASGTTICSGDLVTITSTPLFGGNSPTFNWLLNGASTGETDSTYSSFSLSNGDQVSCIFTSDFLCTTVGADTSNTLTFTVVTPPQVDAGTNMTTCGTTPYTFANGATNSNTTSITWTENGAGSITAGANTLTPTYTPAAGDLGTTVTFTLTGYGSSPCAEIADNVTLTVTPLTLYYTDADSDGYGDPLSSPSASCTPISGKVANNTDCCDTNADINPGCEWWADADGDGVGGFIYATGCISACSGFASTYPYYPGAHGGAAYAIDCNDASSSAYPGATELCGNSIDDDCDQTVDEGCSGIVNDGFAYATLLNVNTSSAYYPSCQNFNGSVLNADISGEGNPANVAVGGGRDSWYRFVAPSSAARITVVPTGFDAVLELRTAAHPVGQVDVENANATVGGTESMNVSGLTVGQTYYLAVRNYNATTGGTFTVCVSPLMPSGCGTAQPTGGYSLCTSYKGIYRGATSYTFNFTGTGGTAPTPYATTSVTLPNAVVTLSNSALALRNGGIYTIRVDANYTLLNGAGVADPTITILGTTTNCLNRTMAAAPLLEVRSTQRCPVTLFRSTYLSAVPVTGATTACGAIAYNYRFTRVSDCTGSTTLGSPFVVTTPNASPYLSLYAAFPNTSYPLPNLGYWKVEVAPVFSYGATAYGPSQVIQVNNTASSTMLPEEAIAAERSETIATDVELYPNPGDGGRVIVTAASEMPITQWAVFDELGRKVEGYLVIPMDGVRYELVFDNTLAAGLYYITWQADGGMQNRRWVVSGK